MATATEHIGVNRRDLAIAWVLVGIAALANIAGYLFNLYDKWVAFDEVIHGFTLLAVTLLLGLWTYRSVLTGFAGHGLLLVLVPTPDGNMTYRIYYDDALGGPEEVWMAPSGEILFPEHLRTKP